jgi:hypothetical protein
LHPTTGTFASVARDREYSPKRSGDSQVCDATRARVLDESNWLERM